LILMDRSDCGKMVMATFVPDGSMFGNRLKSVKSGEF
jgi:hypothetical protein